MKITLKNDFHRTEATVVVKDGLISGRAMKEAEGKLCGMDDCTCGKVRGPQDYTVEPADSEGKQWRVGVRK